MTWITQAYSACSSSSLNLVITIPSTYYAVPYGSSKFYICGEPGCPSQITSLPEVLPLMLKVTPASLHDSPHAAAKMKLQASPLDLEAVRDRFFNAMGGPTNMWNIVQGVNDRFLGYSPALSKNNCTSLTPVAYDLGFPGEDVTMYASCYEGEGGNYRMFGIHGNYTYFIEHASEGPVAAKVRIGPNNLAVEVDIWYGVGLGMNRTGSYAVARIKGDLELNKFEMTTGGWGIGFAGATISTDGSTINVTGCQDNSQEVQTVCSSAANISQVAECSEESNTFMLTPLGRQVATQPSSCAEAHQPSDCNTNSIQGDVIPASGYPGGDENVVDVTGTLDDSVHFGPRTAVAGTGLWQMW